MRIIILVIDSFGIGAMPDAGEYGDVGAHTALHICETMHGDKWQNLRKLGLGNAAELTGQILPGCEPVDNPEGLYGIMKERSPGKDTISGHWELAGIELDEPFGFFPPEYPSFPGELLELLEKQTGRSYIGNKAASGTVIIQELGEEHMKTGDPIAYTSADSVFQIAAHEGVVPLDKLYEICEKTRKLCDSYNVARVIARPFIGEPGNFTRTKSRRDFSIELPREPVMSFLQRMGVTTIGVGKIGDIFNETGLTKSYHDKGNNACLDRTLSLLKKETRDKEFIFVNLVDTDMVYGHRRDPLGYGSAVEAIDQRLNSIFPHLTDDDLLLITADHGCDPTFKGTDHTREYVPLLGFTPRCIRGSIGIRNQFSDVAQSAVQWFGLEDFPAGTTFI